MKKTLFTLLLCCAAPIRADAASIFNDNNSFFIAKAVKLGRGNTNLGGHTSTLAKRCPENCAECDDSGSCNVCKSGYGKNRSGQCVACPSHCSQCIYNVDVGEMSCSGGCASGYHLEHNSTGTHSDCCPTNKILSNAYPYLCVPAVCGAGTYRSSSNLCELCEIGTYSIGNNQTSCSLCSDKYDITDGTCTACTQDSCTAISCNEGFKNSGNNTCVGDTRYICDGTTFVAQKTFTVNGKTISAGTRGGTGCISSYANLFQEGTSWVFPGGSISESSTVSGSSAIYGKVLDRAIVRGNSIVEANAKVYNYATVENSNIKGNAKVFVKDSAAPAPWNNSYLTGTEYTTVENSTVQDNALVYGGAQVNGSTIKDNAVVAKESYVESSTISEHAIIAGARISNNSTVKGKAFLYEGGSVEGAFIGGSPTLGQGLVMHAGTKICSDNDDNCKLITGDGGLALYDNTNLSPWGEAYLNDRYFCFTDSEPYRDDLTLNALNNADSSLPCPNNNCSYVSSYYDVDEDRNCFKSINSNLENYISGESQSADGAPVPFSYANRTKSRSW